MVISRLDHSISAGGAAEGSQGPARLALPLDHNHITQPSPERAAERPFRVCREKFGSSFVLSLKGTQSIAGGQRPRESREGRPTLKGRTVWRWCGRVRPFQGRDRNLRFPGALPPATDFMPFSHVQAPSLALDFCTNY